METINSFGVHFILRHEREKNGKSPVYIRIVVNKTRCELALKIFIPKDDWNAAKGMVKPKSADLKKVNNYLQEVRAKIVNVYVQLEKDEQVITAQGLKNVFLGKGTSSYKSTLCELIKMHNKQMKEVLRPGTMKNYYTTEKYLKLFLKDKFKSSDLYLSKLDFRFITDFEYYLRTNPIKKEDPCTTNGVMKHLERLKKMVSWAVRLKLLKADPFEGFKLRFKAFERGYLEMDDLERLKALVPKNRQIEFVRDLFLFACYTGLAYSDAIALKPSNIETDKDGIRWINTLRQKNKTAQNIIPVCVPLLVPAYAIINKYKDDPRSCQSETLFPSISNQEVNRCLKIIAGISEIEKNMTFHLARHTFATTITLNNGIP